jgi:hypothetical protein
MSSKFSYIGFSIRTDNVNHTGLYKHAQTLPGFKESGFKTMYRTEPGRFKSVTSREHDEVISRSVDVMQLKLQFVTHTDTRYVNVYGKVRTGDEDVEKELVDKLNEFIRKFQRKPESIELKRFIDPKDTSKLLV